MPHTEFADHEYARRYYDEQITAAVRRTDEPLSGDEFHILLNAEIDGLYADPVIDADEKDELVGDTVDLELAR